MGKGCPVVCPPSRVVSGAKVRSCPSPRQEHRREPALNLPKGQRFEQVSRHELG